MFPAGTGLLKFELTTDRRRQYAEAAGSGIEKVADALAGKGGTKGTSGVRQRRLLRPAGATGAPAGRVFLASLLCLWFSVFSGPAQACSFHNYKPQKTLVDWFLTSWTVALARPDPKDPFRYKVTRIYRGTAVEEEIPVLVDSSTRRRLAQNPQDGVLFAYTPAGGWRAIGAVDGDHHALLDVLVRNAAVWRSEAFSPGRFAVLANYQDHANPGLRRLALQEIDRVPYAMLRTMEVRLSDEDLVRSLRSWADFPYRPINLLLLGLKESETAGTFLNAQVELMRDWETADSLGAAATALVEREGEAGVETLARLYLADPSQAPGKLESVVEALAIHSSLGPEGLQATIQQALAGFVARRPSGAAMIARQFSARGDWSVGPYLEAALKAPGDLTADGRLLVAAYVEQARAARK